MIYWVWIGLFSLGAFYGTVRMIAGLVALRRADRQLQIAGAFRRRGIAEFGLCGVSSEDDRPVFDAIYANLLDLSLVSAILIAQKEAGAVKRGAPPRKFIEFAQRHAWAREYLSSSYWHLVVDEWLGRPVNPVRVARALLAWILILCFSSGDGGFRRPSEDDAKRVTGIRLDDGKQCA